MIAPTHKKITERYNFTYRVKQNKNKNHKNNNKMEHIPPKGKFVKECTEKFVVKKNEIPKISGNPNYLSVKLVLDEVMMDD